MKSTPIIQKQLLFLVFLFVFATASAPAGTILSSDFAGVDTSGAGPDPTATDIFWDIVDGITAPAPTLTFNGADGLHPLENEIAVDRNLTTEGPWSTSIDLVLAPGTAAIHLTSLSFNWRVTNNSGSDNTPASKSTTWAVEISDSGGGVVGMASDSGRPGSPAQLRTIDLSGIALDSSEDYTLKLTASGTGHGHNASLLDIALDGDITSGGIGFTIKSINHDSETDRLELTWTSSPDEKFIVKYSRDLADFSGTQDGDLEDGILANEGETTTKTFDLAAAGLADEGRVYFRVEKQAE